jgi:class 3 adenylate cyclase/tetratricopeptide (TPR) repeat protein
MTCPNCGQGNREGAAFCDVCGTALARACPHCGIEVRGGAKFCDSCGKPLVFTEVRAHTPPHLVQKILSERPRAEGERRTVTVLFADTRGFTPLSERHDAEQMYGLTQACIERMLACVHRHEGTVNQFTGDGIMAIFGAPIAHEDSARRAVAAALDMQRELKEYVAGEQRWQDSPVAFRVGLNTGPVVVGRISDDLSMDYTAIGDTVNLAARMEQMCEPGSVYLTENTYRQAVDYFDCEDVGLTDVKGKAEPVHIYKAIGEKAVRTRFDAAIARGLSPFTGRGRELDTLKAFWKDALDARGQIVLISGEPGIGKSRLLLEFRRSLADDVIWREAQCVPYGEGIPYLPVVDLVKSGFGIAESDEEGSIIEKVDTDTSEWTPDGQKTVPYLKYLLSVDPGDAVVENMDPIERRAGILDSLRALILERSRVAPRVVVVEDLHWADDASEEAFRVCADVVAASKVLMILTFRPGYLHPSADMPNAHRVVLSDLDADARRQLASAALEAADLSADLAGPVTNKAEGNPLFIEEVAKALAAGAADVGAVPDSLQDVILARIDRLEAGARGALQLASVIGREFTLRLLNRISDLKSELDGVLIELKMLELIYEKTFFPELAYMFKHALTHDVAYSTLLVERRKALHRVVAAAIEELYSDRIAEHYETLAHHYSQAEQWDKALDFLEQAGDKASASFANQQALDFYARALVACERLGPETRRRATRIAEKRGFVSFTIGDVAQSMREFDLMVAAAREFGDARLEAAGLARRGLAELIAHEFDRAEPSLRAALELAGDAPRDRYLPTLMLAMLLLITNRHDEARPLLVETEKLAPAADDAFADGFWDEIATLLPNWEGRYEEAIAYATDRRVGAESDDGNVQGVAMANLGVSWAGALALAGIGRYQEAIESLERIIARAERIGDVFYRIRSLNSLGWVYIELGDLDRGWEWNTRALDVAKQLGMADPELDSNAQLNLGDILQARGDLDGAEKLYRVVERIYRAPTPPQIWMLWRYGQHMLHSYGELLLARGELARALEFADECLAGAEASRALKNVVKARRLRGQVLGAEGRPDEAERELIVAVDLAREVGNPSQLWKTHAALGDVRRTSQGRTDEALSAYADALAVIDSVGVGLTDAELRHTFSNSPAVRAIREYAG